MSLNGVQSRISLFFIHTLSHIFWRICIIFMYFSCGFLSESCCFAIINFSFGEICFLSDCSKRDRLPPVSLAYLMTYGTRQIFCFSSTIWRSLAEKSSSVMAPRSSPLRVRTETVPFSMSRSPTTSMKGIFSRVASRIFLPIFSLRLSTSTRKPCLRSSAACCTQ